MVISIMGLIIWMVAVNVIGAAMMLQDKRKARRHLRRIPERWLMIIGCLGGAPLMLATMYLIHHKTHRRKFTIGFPIAIVCIILLILFMWYHPDQFYFYWSIFNGDLYLEA